MTLPLLSTPCSWAFAYLIFRIYKLKSSKHSPQFIQSRNYYKNIDIQPLLVNAQSFPRHDILHMNSAGGMVRHFNYLFINFLTFMFHYYQDKRISKTRPWLNDCTLRLEKRPIVPQGQTNQMTTQ